MADTARNDKPPREEAAMRAAIVSLIAAPLALAALPAAAQGNPSSDQIIQSLKPSGNLLGGGTRGIRMANPNASEETPQASSTAPATHPAVQGTRPTQAAHPTRTASTAPGAAADAPSVSLSVQFATGSADLTPAARQTLDQLGKALSSSDLAQYRFRIEGHTDTVGRADYNKTLSQQRADAVAAYLQSKFGVNTDRLQTIGMGEDGLLVPTPPNTPNEKNRRVNVVNLGA
jgi:outer membrane protein OmpA-like peptidoglycan-associated protein